MKSGFFCVAEVAPDPPASRTPSARDPRRLRGTLQLFVFSVGFYYIITTCKSKYETEG